MRWKGGKIGEERTFHKFAFLPEHLDDGYIVWLEFFAVNQVYKWVANGSERIWITTSTEVIANVDYEL